MRMLIKQLLDLKKTISFNCLYDTQYNGENIRKLRSLPFISPFGLTITPALSDERTQRAKEEHKNISTRSERKQNKLIHYSRCLNKT